MKFKHPKKIHLHIETLDRFEAGKAGAGGDRISGNGCTVLTTCSPGCEGFIGAGRLTPG